MTDPFNHHARKPMTDQRKARIFAARNGKCDYCGRKIRPGDVWRPEHDLSLGNGGTDDDDNIYISCSWCWPEKDKVDAGKLAKKRHTYSKHVVPNSQRQKSSLSKRSGYKFDWKQKRYVKIAEVEND